MKNHLKDQSSPYLLQHAENPVDWYPWGEAAFEKAKRENRPVFLSIGYSTCHWCHVMAHESFENKEIADILNRYFVSVKVDREDRPDVDSVYMSVCQALTGSGGWPMSIFMTPQQKPFFAGTYFPPESRGGMVGFYDLLAAIAGQWESDRDRLLESADRILEEIRRSEDREAQNIEDKDLPELAAHIFSRSFDKQWGGFGQAPKFPTPHNLIFLILYSKIRGVDMPRVQAETTLEKMRRGGIFDQIGYGFSRYSTDRYYLVPHFEKMLYDNALLIMAYCAAYKASGNMDFLDTAQKTAAYIFREMTGSDGAFYSAQDADSEGEEGKFYVWSYEEILRLLGKHRGRQFCEYFGITEQGNFDGKNIPNLLNGNPLKDSFERERAVLYDYRKSRARLHLDDKVLTSWNALMICAMAMLYRVTGERCYLLSAQRAYDYIETNLADGNSLYVSCRKGIRSVKGFLEEYAYFATALIFLYEATSEDGYLERAVDICQEAGRQFEDEAGGYFMYGSQNGRLITRPKETYDGALPSGNSVMAWCLVRLSQLTGGEAIEAAARRQLAFMSEQAVDYPAGYGMFLIAQLIKDYPPQKITVVLSDTDDGEQLLPKLPLNACVKLMTRENEAYKLLNGQTTYYVCRNYTCLPPSNQVPEGFVATGQL